MRKGLALSAAAAVIILGASSAVATPSDSLNCDDFETPVVISNGYDPSNLDADGDGIGCEGNPGAPVRTDLYADLRGESPAATVERPSLAHTGAWGPATHPVRWMGTSGALLIGGAAVVIAARRKAVLSES